jgi:hypothetical protein
MSRVNLSRSFLQTRAGTFSWIFPPELKLIPVEPSRAECWQRHGDLMDWPLDYVWMALRDIDSDNALKAMVHAPQNISLRITKQGRGNKACLLLPLRYRLVLIASSGTGRPSQCRLVSWYSWNRSSKQNLRGPLALVSQFCVWQWRSIGLLYCFFCYDDDGASFESSLWQTVIWSWDDEAIGLTCVTASCYKKILLPGVAL